MLDFEIRLQEAKRQYADNNFRGAYEILEELVQQNENVDPTLLLEAREIHKQLPRKASQACNEYRDNVNKIQTVSDYQGVSIHDLQDELDAWRNAILPNDTNNKINYDNTQKRLHLLEVDLQKILIAEPIQQQVQAQWQRARQLRIDNPRIAINRLLEIYTEAERIAREAAAENPENTYLQVLLDDASAYRERLSGEEEAMTSGALMGEYQRVLDHIDQTPENELVPVYDIRGMLIGSMPREEARQTVMGFAQQNASAKANDYIGEAEGHLDNHAPRPALSALAKREKIEAFLNPNDKRRLDDLKDDILAKLRQLEQAEEITQHAADQLDKLGALAAWREYQEGIAKYAGAESSPVVKASREAIITAANQEIRDIATQLQSLYNQDNLSKATQVAENTLGSYRIMNLPSLVEIERWQTEIQHRQQQEHQLQSELQEIMRLATDGSTEQAAQRLQSVDTQYLSTGILSVNASLKSLYDQVKNEVKARSNAKEQLAYLSRALEATTEVTVQEAIKNAERAAEVNSNYREEFHNLRMRLELHLEYLRIHNLAAQHQLEEAVKRLEAIINHPLMTGNYQTEVSNFLDKLKQDYAAQSNNDQILKNAKTLLPNNPEQVHLDLATFAPRNATEERQLNELRKEARSKWLGKIEQAIKSIDAANPPDVDTLDGYERTLRDLDENLHQRYSRRLLVYNLIRQALDIIEARDDRKLAQAIQLLKDASKDASGIEQRVISEKTRKLEQQLKERDKNQLLDMANNQTEDESVLLERLIDMQNTLGRLASETSDPTYALWQLEIMLTQGQYQKDAASSRRIFVNSSILAGRISTELRAAGGLDEDTKTLLRVAEYAPKIGEARLDVEKYLKADSDIGRFSDTIDRWTSVFNPDYIRMMPHLALWYKDLANGVSDDLRKVVRGKSINPDNLEAYARLMILDPSGDFAEEVIARLPSLQKELEEETEKLIQGITTNRDYQATQGVGVLRFQIESFDKHYRKLNTINQVLNRFYKQLGSEADNLLHSTSIKMEDTSRAVGILKNFLEIAQNFEAYLDALTQMRQTVSETEVNHQYDTFEKDVRNLSSVTSNGVKTDLTKHAAVNHLKHRKDNFFTAQTELENLLKKITQMILAEDYSSKLQELRQQVNDQFASQGETLRERRNSFSIFDPWKKETIISWDQVNNLITERKGKLDQVLQWAACFGILEGLLTDNIKANDLPTNPEFRVVDWQEFKAKIEYQIAKAEFSEARTVLKEVTDKTSNQTLRSLPQARNELKILPPGIDVNTVGSQRGRRLLVETQDTYETLYLEQIKEAEQFQDLITQLQQQIKKLEEQFDGGLKVMTENQNYGRWPFGRGNRESYEKGERTARTAIEKIKEYAPLYSRLSEMEKRFNAKKRKP